jgi:hypothetical protein
MHLVLEYNINTILTLIYNINPLLLTLAHLIFGVFTYGICICILKFLKSYHHQVFTQDPIMINVSSTFSVPFVVFSSHQQCLFFSLFLSNSITNGFHYFFVFG